MNPSKNLIKNSILKSSALLKSQQYQLYYSICIKIALLKYLYFQNILAFSYLSILVCYFLLCSQMGSLGVIVGVHSCRPHGKRNINSPYKWGRNLLLFHEVDMSITPNFEGDPTISKQEMSLFKIFKEWVPNPNLFESPPLFILAEQILNSNPHYYTNVSYVTDTSSQSMSLKYILHQRFI